MDYKSWRPGDWGAKVDYWLVRRNEQVTRRVMFETGATELLHSIIARMEVYGMSPELFFAEGDDVEPCHISGWLGV